MALGKRNGSGEILPRLKFDARYGTIYTQDRVYENGEWQPSQNNIELDEFLAVFDMATLEVVWAYFPSSGPPDIVAVPAGQDPGDAPSEKHKQGVRLRVKMSDELGGQVRECISLATGFWYAIDDLHDRYLRELPQHLGQLPIVSIAEMIETKTKQGSAFAPRFVIDGWIGRPGDLPATAPPPPIAKKKAAAQIAAPKPKDEFGDKIPFSHERTARHRARLCRPRLAGVPLLAAGRGGVPTSSAREARQDTGMCARRQ
jgi:hypothetical protein